MIGIDSDPANVNRARRILDDAGVYGSRVSVHCGDPGETPYPRNFANLIVSSQALAGKVAAIERTEVERLQRPYEGVVCLGTPVRLRIRRRGPLDGSGSWTHQNCDPANTICSTDNIIRGTLIAIKAPTGSILWRNDNDVFGTQLAVSDKHGVLLMYYQAVKHNFFKLPSEIGGRMAAFNVKIGLRLWDETVEHKIRPLINGETIYAEGGAWTLKTGEHVPWDFKRSYGCGQIAGSTYMLVFRSATLGYFDLTRNVGTENFGGTRPGCWFNAIIAGGMVLVPDSSSKCACSYQTQSWLALQRQQ